MTAITRRLPVALLVAGIGLLAAAQITAASGDEAEQIMERATARAGGDNWRLADTIELRGEATLYRNGEAAQASDYRMYRVYPRALDAAHTTTGKFRLDAEAGKRTLFRISFDGERMYDQNGPMDPEAAERLAASSFGYSAARFALTEGFSLERLPADQVEGHDCDFVRVRDPSGTQTLFGIDASSHEIRLVAWDTPQGWHHRLYSDFYWVEEPGFLQPGRVRLYYDGVKTADINWRSARINVPLTEELFVLGND